MAKSAGSTVLLLSLLLLLLVLLLALVSPSQQQQEQEREPKKLISEGDLAALAALKDSLTDIPGTNFFFTWDLSSADPCSTFSGVTCTTLRGSGRVTALTLGTGASGSTGLAGSLPPSLSNLTELTQLVLYPGLVTGPIPPKLGEQLINLRVISLTKNRLTGPIPASLTRLPNLHTLDLSYNQLSGSIPAGLFNGQLMPELKVVVLASNALRGELPRSVSTQLLHLDLKGNALEGGLPLGMPSSLRYLSASSNKMWGPLNGLQSLSQLVHLDLSMNHFSGYIPPSLLLHHSSSTLSSLFLQRNNLSGGVPPVQSLTSSCGEGSVVDLSHNLLSGELSPVLAGVESLFLNNNRFIGRVPEEYVNGLYQGRIKTLYLQHNYLSAFPFQLGLGAALPDTASLCLSYNCMVLVPPAGVKACPASAGGQLSRPEPQCLIFKNGTSINS